MRVIAAIVLVTFAASVGCTAHRWKPVEPQPRSDAAVCADLAGKDVYLQLTDKSTMLFHVTECDYPRIRGTVVNENDGSTAAPDTVSYDLWSVTVVTDGTELKGQGTAVLIIGIVAVVVVASGLLLLVALMMGE